MYDEDNNIAEYKSQLIRVDPNFDGAGYFPDTKELKPIRDFNFVSEVLDVMTGAAEAGALGRDTWVSQLFADDEVFQRFADELSSYDEYCRIHDRWYAALFRIVNAVNEEGFVTSEEIAERMLEQAETTGQIIA
jgi:hypothetical protein